MQNEQNPGNRSDEAANAGDPLGFNDVFNSAPNTASTTPNENITNDDLPPLGDWANDEPPTGENPTEDVEVSSAVGEKSGQEQYEEKVLEDLYVKLYQGEWFEDDKKTPLDRLAKSIQDITTQLMRGDKHDDSSEEIPFFREIAEASIKVQLAQSFPDGSSNKEIDSGINKILGGTYPGLEEPSPLSPYPKSLIDRLVTDELNSRGERFGSDFVNASFRAAEISNVKTEEEKKYMLIGMKELMSKAPSVFEKMDSQDTIEKQNEKLASEILEITGTILNGGIPESRL